MGARDENDRVTILKQIEEGPGFLKTNLVVASALMRAIQLNLQPLSAARVSNVSYVPSAPPTDRTSTPSTDDTTGLRLRNTQLQDEITALREEVKALREESQAQGEKSNA